jgi:hypothetical protein
MKYQVNESGEIIKPKKQNYFYVWLISIIVVVSIIVKIYSGSIGFDTKNSVTLPNIQTKNSQNKGIDYSKKIISFINAENERSFHKVHKHFSSNIKRYYNHNYPTYTKLKKLYLDSWSRTKSSKNYIQSIDKIDKNTYNYNVYYDYHLIKGDKKMSIESEIRIVFDDNGKITQLYAI